MIRCEKNKGGRKSKYETHVEIRLFEIECWARDGLIDEQIANNLGVAYSTFREYVKEYSALSTALKRGKEIIDYEVENALLKRALGYEYREKKYAQVEMSEQEHYALIQVAVIKFKLDNPEATLEEIHLVELQVSKYKSMLVEEKTKEVSPDTTAQIFWLKNRRPDKWRDKQDIQHSGSMEINNPLKGLSTEDLKKLIDK
ncbi:transposase [Psychrobacillus sp.]|uniref:transposase n=1 Tax=Psychrobacillus sp. TaxID=1871623 RepID=UPI0028BD377E|nr:transposase [Psychrobacillus sp.]